MLPSWCCCRSKLQLQVVHATFAWHANLLLLHVRSAFRSSVISSTSHSDLFNFALWPARCPLLRCVVGGRVGVPLHTSTCVRLYASLCVFRGVRLWPKGHQKREESKKLKHSAKAAHKCRKSIERQREGDRGNQYKELSWT